MCKIGSWCPVERVGKRREKKAIMTRNCPSSGTTLCNTPELYRRDNRWEYCALSSRGIAFIKAIFIVQYHTCNVTK